MTEALKDSNNAQGLKAVEAAAFLEADRKQRSEKCAAELKLLFERFDCDLVPMVTIMGSQVTSTLRVVAK